MPTNVSDLECGGKWCRYVIFKTSEHDRGDNMNNSKHDLAVIIIILKDIC